jgi:soluble lytic murein transglycosylase
MDPRRDAVEAHRAVWDAAPSSEFAARSLLRAGWLQLWGGDAPGARESWGILGTRHPDPKARAQGLFWLGRGLLGLGEDQRARATLTDAAKAAPEGFEGIRARDLTEGGLGAEPFTRERATHLSDAASREVECIRWVEEWSSTAASADGSVAHLAVIDNLLAVGLRAQALAEGLDAIAAMTSDPQGLYRLTAALERRGLYPVAIHGANQLARISPALSPDRAPRCLQQLMLPLAYSDLVQEAARLYNLDPYILLALLRQESWFGSHALSGAQARGLSQVIPSTAREIAGELGVTPFVLDDLFRPKNGVTFGAWYLNRQVAGLGRRPLLALAAYNGGPGNARRWTQGDMAIDADDFVEAIDFPETRTYVRSIYEIYTRYRGAYE